MEKRSRLRDELHRIIFLVDTPAGKWFDVALIFVIILSVIVVMLDSVADINRDHGEALYIAEWFFTGLFTIEYALRLYCVPSKIRYATSFYGIVDLLAVLPTYVSLLVPGTQYLLVIRVLRVLRIFRVLKILQYVGEASILWEAISQARHKIVVFLFGVVTLAVIMGSMMYLIENSADSGFTSIPTSVYWAIVTLTTVGYGDISPMTPLGQVVASAVMIMGYSIIAVPTGFVSAEFARIKSRPKSTKVCGMCSAEDHEENAAYCKSCGYKL